MKGLLLKDFYLCRKYCKGYLVLYTLCGLMASFTNSGYIVLLYAMLIPIMIPITLLGYDEKSGFGLYAGTMPVNRSKIVSSKYIISIIILCLLMGLYYSASFLLKMFGNGMTISIKSILSMTVVEYCFGCSITLFPIFKYGVEKGRMAYYVLIGLICAGSVILQNKEITINLTDSNISSFVGIIIIIAGIALYSFTWYLSIKNYKFSESEKTME